MAEKKTSEEFVSRALENVQEDRDKLVRLYDSIEKYSVASDDELTEAEIAVNAMTVREHLTDIMNSLVKQTTQVIELAKIKQKSEVVKPEDEEFNDSDYDDVYSAIEKSN